MKEFGRIILELIIIAAVSVVLGLLINRARSDGLTLARDYFGRPKPIASRPVHDVEHGTPPTATNPASQIADSTASGADSHQPADPGPAANEQEPSGSDPAHDEVARRLAEMGLQVISHEDVAAAFTSDQYQVGGIAIIDARDEAKYVAGHIPYAMRLDHYQLDTLNEVLPVAMNAQQVIVYCNGGQCEDSEYVAMDLRDNGVDPSRLFVYIGGITEWKEQGMPVQTGDRFSGPISEGGK